MKNNNLYDDQPSPSRVVMVVVHHYQTTKEKLWNKRKHTLARYKNHQKNSLARIVGYAEKSVYLFSVAIQGVPIQRHLPLLSVYVVLFQYKVMLPLPPGQDYLLESLNRLYLNNFTKFIYCFSVTCSQMLDVPCIYYVSYCKWCAIYYMDILINSDNSNSVMVPSCGYSYQFTTTVQSLKVSMYITYVLLTNYVSFHSREFPFPKIDFLAVSALQKSL